MQIAADALKSISYSYVHFLKNITLLAIFDTNQDISLAEINIKFTKCSNNTVAIVYSKQVVIVFFECVSSVEVFLFVWPNMF